MRLLICYHRYPRLQLEPVIREEEVTDLTRLGCPVGAYVFEIDRNRWWTKIAPSSQFTRYALNFEPVKETNVPKIWRTYAFLLAT